MSHRLTKAELAASLRAAGRTPEEVAVALEWPIDDYRKWAATYDEMQADLKATQDAIRISKAAPDLLAACEADAAFHEHFDKCEACLIAQAGGGYCPFGSELREAADTLRTAAIRKARGKGVPS